MIKPMVDFARSVRLKYRLWRCGRVVEFDGLRIPLPKGVISDNMAGVLMTGNYDQADRHFLKKYLRPNDFVVEIGGGCGVTAMISRRIVGDGGVVITLEPDPVLHAYAERNCELNGFKVDNRQGAAVADPNQRTVTFYKYSDFWASQMVEDKGQHATKLEVAAVYPPVLLDGLNGRRSVLICDVEGFETELLTRAEIVSPYDMILAEIHNYGWPSKADGVGCAKMFHFLLDQGFYIAETAGQSFVFLRKLNGASKPA
ncbi:MAG: FkbM family methyltransferase [Planctomycetota bacterium]|nr:FkbM family methyltransferase [Planctomycetota bacterium]